MNMLEVNALANKLLATTKGQILSKQYLAEIEKDDNLTLTAEVISFVFDRGPSKCGFLPYFLMLYELTKYVREKCQELSSEKERINLLEYVEEGEEELHRIVNSEEELDFLLSQVY